MSAPFCGGCGLKVVETRFCTETGLSHIGFGGSKVTGTHPISNSGTGKTITPSVLREYIDLDAPSSGSDLSAKILQEKKQIGKKDV
jgi:hypothetical protein